MTESNYTALTEGLKLYTDAIRRLIKERLIAAYPNTWWNDGVLRNLTDAQKSELVKNVERHPQKDKLEHVEAGHFSRIIPKNFDSAFHGVFSDFKKTQSLLGTVANARNEWAHPRTGDMLADEVGFALYAMVQVLSMAKLPETSKVEKLRQDVLRLGTTPEPQPVEEAKPAASGNCPTGGRSASLRTASRTRRRSMSRCLLRRSAAFTSGRRAGSTPTPRSSSSTPISRRT